MKYVIMNDFYYIFGREKKITIFYFLFFLGFLFLNIMIGARIDNDFMDILNAINFEFKNHQVVPFILFLVVLCVYWLLSYRLIIKDIRYHLQNIFLRMKPLSWIIGKMISLILYTFSTVFVLYFLLFLICNSKSAIDFDLLVIIKKCMYLLIVQLSFFTTIFIQKINNLCFIVMLLFNLFMLFTYSNITTMNLFYLLLYDVGWLIILLIVFLKKFQYLFEW